MCLLSEHAPRHCAAAGHREIAMVAQSAVCRTQDDYLAHPHKVGCCVERRDPQFDEKTA